MRKKEEIWLSPMTKKQSDNTKMPPWTQRLWTDLWRLVGDKTSNQLVWLIKWKMNNITFYLDLKLDLCDKNNLQIN